MTLQHISLVDLVRSTNRAAVQQPGAKPMPPDSATPAAPAGSSSSSTVVGVLQPGCAADALLVWFDLHAADVVVSTGPTAAAVTCQQDGQPAQINSSTHSDSNSGQVENSAQLHADHVQYHSTEMGMGLYYLDSCIPAATATSQAAVQITTTCSPSAVRLAVHVYSNPAGIADSASCGVLPQQQQAVHNLQARALSSTALATTAAGHAAEPLCINSTTQRSSAASLQQQQPTWSPHGMPRHAWLSRWHFDMLADTQRNNAYEDAIR